jgi:hypothetical protein
VRATTAHASVSSVFLHSLGGNDQCTDFWNQFAVRRYHPSLRFAPFDERISPLGFVSGCDDLKSRTTDEYDTFTLAVPSHRPLVVKRAMTLVEQLLYRRHHRNLGAFVGCDVLLIPIKLLSKMVGLRVLDTRTCQRRLTTPIFHEVSRSQMVPQTLDDPD